jgi:hypothetical protein
VNTHIARGSLFVGALAVLCSLLFALPASAAYDDCGKQTFCLYTGEGGAGTAQRLSLDAAAKATSYDSAWNEKAVSLANNTPYWACLYENTQYGGTVQIIKPNQSGDLARITNAGSGGTLPAMVSSHKLSPSQAGCFTGFERCEEGRLCLFREAGGRGQMTQLATDYRAYSGGWETGVHSVRNRTGRAVCFYDATDWTGQFATGDKAYKVVRGDTTSLEGAFDGTFQSHRILATPKDTVCPS